MISGTTKIQKISVEENKRILAISDIHGEVTYLDGVLKKAHYSKDDVLVIVGDLIEKGRESLKTVRYVMKLKEENPNVYVTMGNVDLHRLCMFFDDSKEGNREFYESLFWTRDIWKRGLFLDILEETGIAIEDVCEENILTVKKQIKEQFGAELDFLWNLPTMIAMGNYIFVHGGIPTDDLEKLAEADPFNYLKFDNFWNQDVAFEKTVVVGHWPTCIYRKDVLGMNPLFDCEKRIISIDGGCALKKNGGQLNALIIPDVNGDMQDLRYVSYDDYPVITARKAQNGKKCTVRISYSDSEVLLLGEKDGIARVKHISTDREFDVPKSELYRSGDKLHCDDYSDAWLAVAVGDELSAIEETPIGTLVKKDGVIGWYKE